VFFVCLIDKKDFQTYLSDSLRKATKKNSHLLRKRTNKTVIYNLYGLKTAKKSDMCSMKKLESLK